MGALQIRDLSFCYPEQEHYALKHVNLIIEEGSFFLLCGSSGCGKSTLLRQMKPSLTPHGIRHGEILWNGIPLSDMDFRTQSQKIGFVQQNPEYQITTDKVWHELAFGLESLGCSSGIIRRRVAEMAAFFGIQTWFHRNTADLSGGQKQLLNLAAVMVMQPDILILDEPTSQLDPIAAAEFLELLARVNREFGTTIILTEHRLEEAVPLASRIAVLEEGCIFCSGTAAEVGSCLRQKKHPMFSAMPCAMQIWAGLYEKAPEENVICPVTVRDGKEWFQKFAEYRSAKPLPEENEVSESAPFAIKAEEVWFRYEKEQQDIIKGFCFSALQGERICILGGNGTGKTTALKLLAGLYKPYRGNIQKNGKIIMLPQNPQTLFVKATVQEDLLEALPDDSKAGETEAVQKIMQIATLCQITNLLERHPYDLSGGEQQRAALAKLLLLEPDVLLLDEPTKGFDAVFKQIFAEILDQLQKKHITVIMVSHDLEFCAQYGQRCMLFFDGTVIVQEAARAFFSGNTFYTTAANRIARNVLPEAVTARDIIEAYDGTMPQYQIRDSGNMQKLFLDSADRTPSAEADIQKTVISDKKKLSARTLFNIWVVLMMIPVTLYCGTRYLNGNSHYAVALLVLLECMLPFYMAFEGRKPQTREIVIIAVICAIAVAGRAAFFMLPQCKPVLAIVILSGAVLGAEAGFLTGSMAMLVSNILFGQGIWTPWQMFAMGLAGFLAGVLFKQGRIPRRTVWLCPFGFLSAVVLYGAIMNGSSALMYTAEWSVKTVMAYMLSGFPMDCMHGAATWIFLWLAAEPVIEKLERVKKKYGILL